MKVWIENERGIGSYAKMFISRGWKVVEDFFSADLILFTGGADVAPNLYGEKTHPKTHYHVERDRMCQYYFKQAVENGKAMAGICRGGQFLNVMNGGKLWQHVDGHTRSHIAKAFGYRPFVVSSTHHQMMRPADDGIIRLVAEQGSYKESMRSVFSKDDEPMHFRFELDEEKEDVEAVWYPKTYSYCYQPHPEFNNDSCRDFFFDELKKLLKVGV